MGHCEIDKKADNTYNLFFNDDRNYGDLTKLDLETLPDFDFMIAGFPCQTFSIVGKREGLNDRRGEIIYNLIEILKYKEVKYFIFENVKGLVSHNKGETFRIIKESLENAGYTVYYNLLNSVDYGVPQKRERIYMVGFKNGYDKGNFEFPSGYEKKYSFNEILDEDNRLELDVLDETFQKYLGNRYNKGKYTNEDILSLENCVIDWRQSDLRVYREVFPTLRTGRHGLTYIKNGKIRKLSGYEALLLQGFPKNVAKKVKEYGLINNQVLSQAGNAMTVTVIDSIVKQMFK